MVFSVIDSPITIYVNAVNAIIPTPNEMSLGGHNNPSKCKTKYLVAIMNIYDNIVPPKNDTNNGLFLNQGHTN